MRASVRFRLPNGDEACLGPGDLIGRVWSAALRHDDPHISEAHALVSLRGESLWLIALRRRLWVDGQPLGEVELLVGQRVRLSAETELLVAGVTLPESVLGLALAAAAPIVLTATCSLLSWPQLRLVPGVNQDASAVIWTDADGWRIRLGDHASRPLVAGDELVVDGHTIRAVAVPLGSAGQDRTRSGPDDPLRIVARFDTLHLYRGEAAPLVLSGLQARLLSELVSVAAPVAWEEVAAVLWPTVTDRPQIRRRWDVCMTRLRERLREAGVRSDLIRSTGSGLVELVLHANDTVEDRT